MATDHRSGDHRGVAAPPFGDVYVQHRRRVFAICVHALGNADDAEDATQETFTRAARHLAGFEGNVAAYLTVVARNVCCDEVRRRSLQRRAASELGRRGGREEIEARAVDRSVLSRLLPRLTRGERELLLNSFAGYSYDEIADRVGSPVGTVRVRLARARKRARGLAGGMAGVLLVPAWRLLRRSAQRAGRAPGSLVAVADQAALVSGAVVTSLVAAAVAGGLGAAAVRLQPPATAASAGSHSALQGGGAQAPAVPGAQAGGAPAAAPPSSSPAGTRPAGGGAASAIVPRGSEVGPGQSWIDGFAVSPAASAQPGPVFAWGHTGATCNGACELLYRTDDGGRTWVHLAANGLVPARVLVPPTFPADPTLFGVPPTGALLVSHDAGSDWAAVAGVSTTSGIAAVVPLAGGHPRIAVDQGDLVVKVYDATQGAVTSSYQMPAQVSSVVGLAYAGGSLLVSVERTQVGATLQLAGPAVLACQASCAEPSQPRWTSAQLTLVPVAGAPSLAVVLDGGNADTTDGSSFAPLGSTGLSGSVDAASARLAGGVVHAVVQAYDGSAAAVLVTPGGAAPLRSLPNGEASGLLLLPSDAILAAGVDLDGSSHPGPRCSHDLGGGWTTAC